MKVTLLIPDGMPVGKKLSGTLFLSTSQDGCFTPWGKRKKKDNRFRKTKHGKVIDAEDHVSFNLYIDKAECINAGDAIVDEAWDAKMFLERP